MGKAAWQRVIALAPPGLLRACDVDLVAALAAAIARHERAVMMSQSAWQKRPDDPALFFNIERHVRPARRVSELAASLGLSPPARSAPLPTPPPAGTAPRAASGSKTTFGGLRSANCGEVRPAAKG